MIEKVIESISKRLPWQGGLSPLHGGYYPKVNSNHGWRKLVRKPKKNISNYDEFIAFFELPMSIQQNLISEFGLTLKEFKNLVDMDE